MAVTAVFKGMNNSLGFEYGRIYTLIVKSNSIETLDGRSCSYDSIEAFLKNWDIIARTEI